MRHRPPVLLLLLSLLSLSSCPAQEAMAGPYTYKPGDRFGTGKWYMGREIAQVMGYQGIGWLDRPEREEEEKASALLKNMDIQPGDTIADIGAGSGYHVFKIAPLVPDGVVYAVDIQEEMLAAIGRKLDTRDQKNIRLVQGHEKGIGLPGESVDKVLLVDVYHEFSYPLEMMASIRAALKPGGRVFLIEYRGEDDRVPIKKVHKMTEAQAVKEMEAAGFYLEANRDNLPWQHCMIFRKK